MELRYYQTEAVEAIYQYFEDGNEGNPLVAMPTGTGKSVVIAEFVRTVFMNFRGQRILKLTHVKELIQQNYEKLMALFPTAPAGIYSSGLGRREIRPITFAGIGSVVNRAQELGFIDLVLIDEAHMVPTKESTNYRRLLNELRAINPEMKVIGFTATPYRLGQGMLTDEGGIFTDVCYDITGLSAFNRLIGEGYLAPLVPVRTQKELDLTGVRIQGGEFNQADLQGACDRYEISVRACNEMIARAEGREHWLVFGTGVEHCEHVAEILCDLGVAAHPVHSKMEDAERDRLIAGFKAGEIKCLVNNNILTTGFDAPFIDMIGVLQPTNSCARWVQMLGRGTRPCEGKDNCLVLDFAGNTRRLGPINDPQTPRKKGKGKGQAPVRICPKCDAYNHASARVCEHCGEVFEMAVKFGTRADSRELIVGTEPVYQIADVANVVYSEHPGRDGKPPSLKVSYVTPSMQRFTEWQCLQHPGGVSIRAAKWWIQAASYKNPKYNLRPPETIEEALTRLNELAPPKSIRVWTNTKHPRIMARDWTGAAFGTRKL